MILSISCLGILILISAPIIPGDGVLQRQPSIVVATRFVSDYPPTATTLFKIDDNTVKLSVSDVTTCIHVYLLQDRANQVRPPFYRINICNTSIAIETYERILTSQHTKNIFEPPGNKIEEFWITRTPEQILVRKRGVAKPLIKYTLEGSLKFFKPFYYTLAGGAVWKVYPRIRPNGTF